MIVNVSHILNEYIIHSKIGGENFSTIYEATHKQDGVKRAIKVMDLDKFCSVDFKFNDKVKKQIELLQRINKGQHPNIIHYHKISHFARYIIFEMQYIKGININEFIRGNNYFVEIDEIINLVIDIGGALKFLHHDICELRDAKIKNFALHNDIHTRNILRDDSGKYILIDLDFAIEGSPNDYEKQHHIDLIGAPCFKAPEKWRKGKNISTQSDVYSFGVAIYWFLTGEPPFSVNGSNVTYERLIEPLKDIPTSIFKFRKRNFEHRFPHKIYVKDYPNWLEELILRCLKKDYHERFKDGNELLEYIMSNLE